MPEKKPEWVIKKERQKKVEAAHTYWLFGIHAVRDALENPGREKIKLLVTENALQKLEVSLNKIDIETVIVEPKKFNDMLDKNSVHQGAALEVKPLKWGNILDVCTKNTNPVILLDRVSDPHNVGAILRSAEVFGVQAVIGTQRHSAPETGALAKSASGTLERQPYLRIRNLSDGIDALKTAGFIIFGLDGLAERTIKEGVNSFPPGPLAFVLGAEGPGLREKTKKYCDLLVKIPSFNGEGSLNVSNATAVALYEIVYGNRS